MKDCCCIIIIKGECVYIYILFDCQ